jgi:hypothetical protein
MTATAGGHALTPQTDLQTETETNNGSTAPTTAPDPSTKNPGWTPTRGVTDHAGRKLPGNLIFFAPPPPELGEVVSAWSELRVGEAIWTLWQRLGLYAAITAVASFPFLLQVYNGAIAANASTRDAILRSLMTAPAFGILGLMALWLVRKPTITRTCTYVCRDGAAAFTMSAGRPPRQRALVSFDNVEALFYSEARSSNSQFGALGGLFSGSKFRYTVKDAAGKTLLCWKGSHTSASEKAEPNTAYSFGAAMERAWTRQFLRRTASQLESGGHVTFSAGATEIRVGRGWLEIIRKGKTDRISPDELSEAKVIDGVFNLFVNGEANLLGPRPRLTCLYARVPNGAALLALLAGPFRNRAGTGMRPAA